jgi:hypothetical protein
MREARQRMNDCLDLPVTLEQAQSLAAVNDFVEGLLACEARVVQVLEVAACDASPMVQACCAALHLFAESRDGPANARPFLNAALASPIQASLREQRFVAAIEAWAAGDTARCIALLQEQVREHPRDLAALKLAHYHLFNAGDSPGMLRLALLALPAAGDVAWLHGMLAFAWEQCHFLPQAEAAARRALSMQQREPWAQHALAHVMLTQGRIAEGADFMAGASGLWTGLNSFMVTHNWWHLALFEIERGRPEAALALYDRQVWGVVKEYSQDQIGAVSLLARLELCGVDVGKRWQDVADFLASRTDDHVLPFLDMQYLYGLARAGRPQARQLLRNMERHATELARGGDARAPLSNVWNKVCLPASRGLLAHAEGEHALAVEQLGQALPNLLAIGGSHAQRDLFEQIHLDALMKSGQWVAAQHIVQQRLASQPESVRLRRLSTQVLDRLDLHDVALMPA